MISNRLSSSQSRNFYKFLELVGIYAALAIVLFQTLYPLLWVLFGSLKSKNELINNIWGAPVNPVLDNYFTAWQMAEMGTRILNSVTVTVLSLLILVIVVTPCSYALARVPFRGRNIITGIVVGSMLVPPQVLAIPLFLVARDLGIINSLVGISFIYAASVMPLSIFIMRSFFKSLPDELEDAALVDGAGRITLLVKIMLPLARPGMALIIIFGFIEVWNDFFLAFLLLRQPAVQTIPLGLVNFFQQYDSLWNLYFAALMITTLPVIIIFLLMQRQFIAGLTAGAVKA